jgi:hypothetical protein
MMGDQKEAGRRGGCFRYGCFGCLALLVLLLIGSLTIVAIGWMLGVPEGEVERPRLTRQLPAPTPGDASADRSESAPIGELMPLDQAAGRVILDLNEGSFRIVPAPPGEPAKVEGRFDSGVYELEEILERPEGEPWTYRVNFDRRVSWVRALFDEADQDNRITISLPRGTPFVLEGAVGVGESILDLSGLSIQEVDLELGTGSHTLQFGEPSPIPMESFTLGAAIGELRVTELGNASPQLVNVKHRIGEVDIDLKGAWLRDAEVDVRCGIGLCLVRVPQDIGLEVLSTDITLGEVTGAGLGGHRPLEEGKPVLRLDLSGRIGEVMVTQ